MYKSSKRMFYIFLWLLVGSIVGILFYSFAVMIIGEDSIKSTLWINYLIYPVALFPIIFYSSKKLNKALKPILGLLTTAALFLGAKYGLAKLLNISVINDFTLLLIAGIMYIFMLLLIFMVTKKLRSITRLLDNENTFKTKEEYLSWLREEQGGSGDKSIDKKYVSQISLIAIPLLVLIFFSISKTPDAKLLLSIFFVLFALSALGVYLILFQFKSILKWKIEEFDIPKNLTKQWNVLIRLLYIPLIIIPLAIPWNFQIFKTNVVRDFINNKMSGVTIDIGTQSTPTIVDDEGITNTNITTSVETENLEATEAEEAARSDDFWIAGKIFVGVILGIMGLYFIFAIIGAILNRKFRYTRRTNFAQFFINRYYSLRKLMDIIFAIFIFIGKLFGSLFGGNRKKKIVEEEQSEMEQQLFSLFNFDKKMDEAKKEEIRTVIKEFVGLIEIISRIITPYRFYYGPEEYIDMIIKRRPSLTAQLRRIVDTFNESRYSLHILSIEKIDTFKNSIVYVINTITETETETETETDKLD